MLAIVNEDSDDKERRLPVSSAHNGGWARGEVRKGDDRRVMRS